MNDWYRSGLIVLMVAGQLLWSESSGILLLVIVKHIVLVMRPPRNSTSFCQTDTYKGSRLLKNSHVCCYFSVCFICFGFIKTPKPSFGYRNERFELNLFVGDHSETSFGSNFGCFEGHPILLMRPSASIAMRLILLEEPHYLENLFDYYCIII